MLFLVPEADTPVLWPPSLFSSFQPLRALAVLLTSPAPITLLLSVLYRVCCHRVHAKDTLCLSFEEQTEISLQEQEQREQETVKTSYGSVCFDYGFDLGGKSCGFPLDSL